VILDTFRELKPEYPKTTAEHRKQLAQLRKTL
jgi:hypothetical protein